VVAQLRPTQGASLVYVSQAEYNLTLYASSFVDEGNRLLYIVTSGGQIVRQRPTPRPCMRPLSLSLALCVQAKIHIDSLQLLGRMTLHAQLSGTSWDNSRGAAAAPRLRVC
jgi:hypothetical protein